MTLYQFVRTLAARWSIILGSVVILLLLIIVVMLVFPAKYTAAASVVVSSQSQDPLLANNQYSVSDSYVATQADIIGSPHVARGVVQDLNLDRNPELIQEWRDDTDGHGDLVAWIADTLTPNLKVKPARNSNVIDIEFTSRNPHSAALVANAFAVSYLKTTTDLKIEPAKQSAQFFDVRIGELRGQLEQAQSRLADAQRTEGVVVNPERLDVENSHLADLSSQLAVAQSQEADSASRSRGAAGNSSVSPDVIQNAVVQTLKTQIAVAESKQKELSTQLGPNHPQYLAGQQELENLRASLATESARVGSSLNTANRVGIDRAGDLRTAVDQQRQRIIDLAQKKDRLSVLQREVDNADKAYQLVMERYAQTSIESHVAQADVALLTSATDPVNPSFPRIKLFLALGLFFGVLLGVGIALIVEIFNPTVHSAGDIQSQVGIPVFVVVPAMKTRRARFLQWVARFRHRKSAPSIA